MRQKRGGYAQRRPTPSPRCPKPRRLRGRRAPSPPSGPMDPPPNTENVPGSRARTYRQLPARLGAALPGRETALHHFSGRETFSGRDSPKARSAGERPQQAPSARASPLQLNEMREAHRTAVPARPPPAGNRRAGPEGLSPTARLTVGINPGRRGRLSIIDSYPRARSDAAPRTPRGRGGAARVRVGGPHRH